MQFCTTPSYLDSVYANVHLQMWRTNVNISTNHFGCYGRMDGLHLFTFLIAANDVFLLQLVFITK